MGTHALAVDDTPGVVPEMNTTPLIDVMLVLLIMFIITIPVQTHGIRLDLPRPGSPPIVDPVKNKIVIDAADRIFWNGRPVDLPALARSLAASVALPEKPELHLEPTPDARYETVDEVLAVTKKVGVEAMGFVGNERYKTF